MSKKNFFVFLSVLSFAGVVIIFEIINDKMNKKDLEILKNSNKVDCENIINFKHPNDVNDMSKLCNAQKYDLGEREFEVSDSNGFTKLENETESEFNNKNENFDKSNFLLHSADSKNEKLSSIEFNNILNQILKEFDNNGINSNNKKYNNLAQQSTKIEKTEKNAIKVLETDQENSNLKTENDIEKSVRKKLSKNTKNQLYDEFFNSGLDEFVNYDNLHNKSKKNFLPSEEQAFFDEKLKDSSIPVATLEDILNDETAFFNVDGNINIIEDDLKFEQNSIKEIQKQKESLSEDCKNSHIKPLTDLESTKIVDNVLINEDDNIKAFQVKSIDDNKILDASINFKSQNKVEDMKQAQNSELEFNEQAKSINFIEENDEINNSDFDFIQTFSQNELSSNSILENKNAVIQPSIENCSDPSPNSSFIIKKSIESQINLESESNEINEDSDAFDKITNENPKIDEKKTLKGKIHFEYEILSIKLIRLNLNRNHPKFETFIEEKNDSKENSISYKIYKLNNILITYDDKAFDSDKKEMDRSYGMFDKNIIQLIDEIFFKDFKSVKSDGLSKLKYLVFEFFKTFTSKFFKRQSDLISDNKNQFENNIDNVFFMLDELKNCNLLFKNNKNEFYTIRSLIKNLINLDSVTQNENQQAEIYDELNLKFSSFLIPIPQLFAKFIKIEQDINEILDVNSLINVLAILYNQKYILSTKYEYRLCQE